MITTPNSSYEAALPSWSRVRDVLAGEDAVKAAGERYLPRVQSHSDDEYASYQQRASFFNATARTAEGYVGLIFRRPPFIKLPDSPGLESHAKGTKFGVLPVRRGPSAGSGTSSIEIRKSKIENVNEVASPSPHASRITRHVSPLHRALSTFTEDCDLLGSSFQAYAKAITTECVGVGRAGTLIDWEEDTENRAFATTFTAEQILNWRVTRVNGRRVPTLIILREWAPPAGTHRSHNLPADPNPFAITQVERIRVLKLIPSSDLGSIPQPQGRSTPRANSSFSYIAEYWEQTEDPSGRRKPEWKLMDTLIPTRVGQAVPLIPFVFHGPNHSRPDIDKSPLNDIIPVNLDHYRLDADYKHGLHFTALPTAWVSGFDKGSALKIGSTSAWVTESPNAKAGYLEFQGHGLTSFEHAMDRQERLMAVLGSRLLENQKRVGETAQAIELRQSGENSILSNIAASVSESLTQVLRWAYWWHSTEDSPDTITDNQALVRLNTDFSLKGMTSQELQAIVAAWQSGAISQSTMFELFRRGEILPDGRTNPEESHLIASERSAAPTNNDRHVGDHLS